MTARSFSPSIISRPPQAARLQRARGRQPLRPQLPAGSFHLQL